MKIISITISIVFYSIVMDNIISRYLMVKLDQVQQIQKGDILKQEDANFTDLEARGVVESRFRTGCIDELPNDWYMDPNCMKLEMTCYDFKECCTTPLGIAIGGNNNPFGIHKKCRKGLAVVGVQQVKDFCKATCGSCDKEKVMYETRVKRRCKKW